MPKSIKTRAAKVAETKPKASDRREVVYLPLSKGMTHEGRLISPEDIEKKTVFSLKLGPAVACVRAGMAEPKGWSIEEASQALLKLHQSGGEE